ncbi:MAG: tetratricopeptide repeat protein [Betaproteobacteria bacterium AqS2]|uniref:Tetratricopeptide repeat protein n=1 Tax=Candidatus Amphirhobacter heronislandensis TaxID=1732024 RepID=A0A930XYH8_9GAMM|nr:tetratricopeptide repeat protein [Betaproteobacteria bacterium AqS2]
MPLPTNSPKLEALQSLYEELVAESRDRLQAENAAFEASFSSASSGSGFLSRMTGKHLVFAGAGVGVLVVAIIGLISFQNAMRPAKLLETYEEQLREELYDEAHATISEYFDFEEENWDLTASHAQLLMELGNYEDARVLYARLIARSPLAGEPSILFLSGMSYLPDETATRIKMTEVLADSPHVPALIARALLENQALEKRALPDIETAIEELARIPSEGESYRELQDLTRLFIINICRNKGFREDTYVNVANFPAGLRSTDLYLFGLDPRVSLNFCSVVPTGRSAVRNIDFDLESVALGLKAFMLARLGNFEEANKVMVSGGSATQNSINAYIDAVIAFREGDFTRAETALLATDYIRQPSLLHYHSIAMLLQGPEKWEPAFDLMKRALSADENSLQILNNHAVVAMIEKRYGQAKKDLEKALEIQNQYAYANYNQAILLLEVDREPEQALPIFQGIVNQYRAFPGVRHYFALANIAADDPDAAVLLLKNNETEPHFGVLSKIALADFYAREYQGELTAVELYTEAFAEDPTNFEAGLKIALVTARQGKIDQALRGISKIEEFFNDDVTERDRKTYEEQLNAIKGEIYHYQGADRAEGLLQAAVESTENPELYIHLVGLYTDELVKREKVRAALEVTRTALPTAPTDVRLLTARAKALLAANDLEEAFKVLDRAEADDAANAELMRARAQAHAQGEQWADAIQVYQDIYILQPTNPAPLVEAIEMLRGAGVGQRMIDELEDQIVRIQSKPDEQLQQVRAQDTVRSVSPAQEQSLRSELANVQRLLANDEVESYSGHMYLGYLHHQLGDYAEALENYGVATQETARADREGNPILLYEPWTQIAQINIVTGNYEDAHEAIDQAIGYNPPPEDLINMTITRAGVRERLRDLDGAIADYGFVIDSFPNYYLPYYRRCLLYIEQNKHDEAISDCTTAIRIDPESIDAFKARHSAFSQIGDSAGAAKDASKITLLEAQQ